MKAKYQEKADEHKVVEAEQLTVATEIQVPGGTEPALPGDWLITDADGVQLACSDALFNETYEPLGESHAPVSEPAPVTPVDDTEKDAPKGFFV